MPLHIYECKECGAEFSELRTFGEEVGETDCNECEGKAIKVWRTDTIGSFDATSAQPRELYFNEQLGKVVHQGREIEECQPMVEAAQEKGRPMNLDWK